MKVWIPNEIVFFAFVGALCPEELEALKTWKPPEGLVEAKEKVLVEQGRDELRGIGKRFKERFSNLLAPAYHKDTHKVRIFVFLFHVITSANLH